MPVISATWEAEKGELLSLEAHSQSEQHKKTLSQKKKKNSQVWFMPVILAFRRRRQGDQEFEASLDYTGSFRPD
jgi:hypothetical protein